ncbi:MAG: recombinase family protein, partial [bacterium]
GELEYALPVGLSWTHHGKIELDPDQRIQEAIHLVFRKFVEVGSARQVLLWFRSEKFALPALSYGQFGREIQWALPVYSTILKFLQNPLYAGAYVFGRRETRTQIVDGRARKSDGHLKPMDRWTVLLRSHHPGYISWQQFERNQLVLEENAHMRSGTQKAGRGGRCLLAGLLRCRRCGRMLHVGYTGIDSAVGRYFCRGAHLNHGTGRCISFGAIRPDRAIATEILHALESSAVDAALQAAERLNEQHTEQRKVLETELEQARYESRLAARRYDAVDPDQRLVAAELEARWNGALARIHEIESRLGSLDKRKSVQRVPDRASLLALAQDLPAVWDAPSADARLKQRLVRLLIHEIVADVDEGTSEILMTVHWAGGRHSELRVPKNKTGQHHRCTDLEAVDVVRHMAGKWSDEQIATTLNRLGLRTGAGNAWVKARVASLRSYHGFPAHDPSQPRATLTLEQAAERLGVSETVVRRLISTKMLPATQVIAAAPWEIAPGSLELAAVKAAVRRVRAGSRAPRSRAGKGQLSIFPNE